jgi:hypothetical protein
VRTNRGISADSRRFRGRGRSRTTDAEVAVAPDGDASGEVIQVHGGADAFHCSTDCARGLVVGPDDEDTAVSAGWVGADVAESPIERDQQAAVCGGTGQHVRVVGSVEPLGVRGVGVVAGVDQRGDG